MEAKPLAIQLYTLRDIGKQDYYRMLKTVADIGYVGVETGGLMGHSATDVRKMLDDLGLVCVSTHGPMPTAENIDTLVAENEALGTNLLITNLGPDAFKTAEARQEAVKKFMTADELVSGSGMRFGYHNHHWEFDILVDGQTGYDYVYKHVPVMFSELDIYWTSFGKADAAEVLKRHGGNIPLIHVKDGSLTEKKWCAVGQGSVDVPRILKAADWRIVQWLIVEIDAVEGDMVRAVKQSYDYLLGTGLAKGRK